MKNRLILSIVPLLFAAACATTGPAVTAGAAPDSDLVIDLQPILRFSPTPQSISVGDTVEFQNVSAFVHSVSTQPATPGEAASTQLPVGAESFDSGDIEAGGIYRHTFTIPGTYRYFCDPHHGAGMVGTIIVTEG